MQPSTPTPHWMHTYTPTRCGVTGGAVAPAAALHRHGCRAPSGRHHANLSNATCIAFSESADVRHTRMEGHKQRHNKKARSERFGVDLKGALHTPTHPTQHHAACTSAPPRTLQQVTGAVWDRLQPSPPTSQWMHTYTPTRCGVTGGAVAPAAAPHRHGCRAPSGRHHANLSNATCIAFSESADVRHTRMEGHKQRHNKKSKE